MEIVENYSEKKNETVAYSLLFKKEGEGNNVLSIWERNPNESSREK